MISRHLSRPSLLAAASVLVVLLSRVTLSGQHPELDAQDGHFRFRTNVELVSVSATVTDAKGRFVPGLSKADFRLYEDDHVQEITHFSSDRVPVSLGVAIDTSGSMDGDKWRSAVKALERLLELLRPGDEVFLYRFSSDPTLVHDWTTDYRSVRRALDGIRPDGGTALHDAVAETVLRAQSGRHRKKTVLVISDGNDTSSELRAADLRQRIRETEVMVYSIAIAGDEEQQSTTPQWLPPPRRPIPLPFPIPGRRWPGRQARWDQFEWPPMPRPIGSRGTSRRDVNVVALREITDDSGGRTEIVRSARDLKPAAVSIANEISQQYYLAYPGNGIRDGRWHSIRVEARDANLRVRARRGYTATR